MCAGGSAPTALQSSALQSPALQSSPNIHHVHLRRISGDCWQYQYFYHEFRAEFSHQLGVGSVSNLSLYSPMRTPRQLSPIERRGPPAPGWSAQATSAQVTPPTPSHSRLPPTPPYPPPYPPPPYPPLSPPPPLTPPR